MEDVKAGDDRQRVVSAVSRRRPRCGDEGRSRARRRAATRRSSSRSIRPSPACASAIRETASRSCSRATCRRSRTSARCSRVPAGSYTFFGDGGLMNFPNIVLADGPMGYADVGAALEASVTSWDDFKWIRDAWGGPIVAKGVHTADDARQGGRSRRRGDRRVESWRAAARWRGADDPRAARSGAGRQRPDRDPARRRHPPRQRHRQGAVHGRASGADRPRLRVRTGAGGDDGVTGPSRSSGATSSVR